MTDPPASDRPPVDPAAILDRMEDGFFALDTDWHVTYANDRGREVLRLAMPEVDEDGPVAGRHLWEGVPAAVGTTFYPALTCPDLMRPEPTWSTPSERRRPGRALAVGVVHWLRPLPAETFQ